LSTTAFDDLVSDDIPADHRSGFITVIGRPNVGKSTLLNHFLGQKIAIVSPKPQTTRNRLLGILNLPDDMPAEALPVDTPPAQLIFVDTPGIHKPHHKLGQFLVDTATDSILNADMVIWLVDASHRPSSADRLVAEVLHQIKQGNHFEGPILLALNKIDLLNQSTESEIPSEASSLTLDEAMQPYLELGPIDHWLPISAVKGDNLTTLLQTIIEHLPLGPRFFPKEQVTDQHLRFMAAELIREAALHLLQHEVPHAIAVGVMEYKERSETMTYINAEIMVERASQKKIVIGKKGNSLKRIGQRARQSLEELTGTQVYLDLWVKVVPKWRTRDRELQRLGYATG